jgi:hypothetical protein
MHLLIARGLGHLVVIPVGGLLAMTWAHLGFTWMVAVDVLAVVLLEMLLVGGPVPLMLGAKSIVPAVLGAVVLPRFLLQPTTTAVVFCCLIVAAAVAGTVPYLIRTRRHTGNPWGRMIASLACLTVAATAEVSVAGLALTMGGLEPAHIVAALAPTPLWLAAYYLQTSPRRGESRTRWPRRMWRFPTAVLSRVRDKASVIGLVGGVRP